MWQRKTDDRHENGKKYCKANKKTWDKKVCVCVRQGGKEMALVFKQKGKAKHFGEL